MKKFILFILIAFMIFSCNQSEADKIGNDNYLKFKAEIKDDKLSVFAEPFAENVVFFSTDKKKVDEAKSWLKKREVYFKVLNDQLLKKHKENSAFLSRIFTLRSTLDIVRKCNYLNAHYLAEIHNSNKDSLLKAMQIFTDSVFLSMKYKEGCSPSKCLLFIYENKKDFGKYARKWIVTGRRMSGKEATVEYSYYK